MRLAGVKKLKRFYERFGFAGSTLDPLTVMITIAEVAKTLRDKDVK